MADGYHILTRVRTALAVLSGRITAENVTNIQLHELGYEVGYGEKPTTEQMKKDAEEEVFKAFDRLFDKVGLESWTR